MSSSESKLGSEKEKPNGFNFSGLAPKSDVPEKETKVADKEAEKSKVTAKPKPILTATESTKPKPGLFGSSDSGFSFGKSSSSSTDNPFAPKSDAPKANPFASSSTTSSNIFGGFKPKAVDTTYVFRNDL